ncbi:unnamed protein product [Porites lobata]|uniref:Uncharacterized protein n=1 Tax=Porites lobata TaxID=104759 RepID=A0ABN8MW54_9CNID|nr:unnamed protein product [Porites lobata]
MNIEPSRQFGVDEHVGIFAICKRVLFERGKELRNAARWLLESAGFHIHQLCAKSERTAANEVINFTLESQLTLPVPECPDYQRKSKLFPLTFPEGGLKSKKSADIKSDLVKVLLKRIYLNGDTMGLLLIYELKSGNHIQSKYYQVKALLPTNKVLPKQFTFRLQYKHSGTFAKRKYEELSYPKNQKMCGPIQVTL